MPTITNNRTDTPVIYRPNNRAYMPIIYKPDNRYTNMPATRIDKTPY